MLPGCTSLLVIATLLGSEYRWRMRGWGRCCLTFLGDCMHPDHAPWSSASKMTYIGELNSTHLLALWSLAWIIFVILIWLYICINAVGICPERLSPSFVIVNTLLVHINALWSDRIKLHFLYFNFMNASPVVFCRPSNSICSTYRTLHKLYRVGQ